MALSGRRYSLALLASVLLHGGGGALFVRRAALAGTELLAPASTSHATPSGRDLPTRPVEVSVIPDPAPPSRGSAQAAPALLRAVPGDGPSEVPRSSAPTRAPNPDRWADRAAASSDRGRGVRELSLTGRRDLEEMRAQPFDGVASYRLQRIRTGAQRESREEVRATPHPGPTAHLASATGAGHGRRRPGTALRGDPSSLAAVATLAQSGYEPAGDAGLAAAQRVAQAPRGGRRIGKEGEAAEGFARPMIAAGPAATEAPRRSDEVRDRSDSPMLSNELRPGPLELSHPGFAGPSDRGRGEGDAPAWASHGRGVEAVPAGDPDAPLGESLEQANYRMRYSRYLADVRQRIDPLWELPHDLAIQLEQGDVLVAYTIRRDGSIKNVHVVKSSGFHSFDSVVLAAIRRAAPYPPLDPVFGDELRLSSQFEGRNPVVR